MDVVSAGFPVTGLPNIVAMALAHGYVVANEEPTWLTLQITVEPEMAYSVWKQALVAATVAPQPLPEKAVHTTNNACLELLREVEHFRWPAAPRCRPWCFWPKCVSADHLINCSQLIGRSSFNAQDLKLLKLDGKCLNGQDARQHDDFGLGRGFVPVGFFLKSDRF